MDGSNDGPSFRSAKRQKVFRKRAESDTNDKEPYVTKSHQPTDGDIKTLLEDDDSPSRPEVTRVRRPKKHGIAFSTSDRSSSRPQNDNEETALIISEPQAVEQQNKRFMRQTGKAIIEDNKHMCVFATPRASLLAHLSQSRTNSVGRHT
jgi:hypothetical protein